MKLSRLQFVLVMALALAQPTAAQIFANDDAGNGVVWTNNPPGVASQSWTNGQNTGSGWTSPWVLLQTVRDDTHQNYAGFYCNNGGNIATTNNSSWGMYANGNYNGATPLYNGTNKAVAFRGFPSLTTNQVFKIQWLCKGVASGGTTNTCLSNRPGRSSAGSSLSSRFDAAITTTSSVPTAAPPRPPGYRRAPASALPRQLHPCRRSSPSLLDPAPPPRGLPSP